MQEDPRTAAEVRKWTGAAYKAFRARGIRTRRGDQGRRRPLRGTESAVRNGPTLLTELICDAMRHEAGTEIAILNAGSIRIDDVLTPGPVTQLRRHPRAAVRRTRRPRHVERALLAKVLAIGEQNKGSGGYLLAAGLPAALDPRAGIRWRSPTSC